MKIEINIFTIPYLKMSKSLSFTRINDGSPVKPEIADEILTDLYRRFILSPPMDTDQQIREAYWKYYPDYAIQSFGEAILIEQPYFPHLFPANCQSNHKWTRMEIKTIVDGLPNKILYSTGY